MGDCKTCAGSPSAYCGCEGKGTKTRTCDPIPGEWSDWGECSVGACPSCDESSKPASSESCGKCGTRTRTVTCGSEGEWVTSVWGSCTGEGVCYPYSTESEPCPAGFTGQKTRACSSSCQWGPWWSNMCKEESHKYVQIGTISKSSTSASGCPDKSQMNCSGNGGSDGSFSCSLDKVGIYSSGPQSLVQEYLQGTSYNYEIVNETITAGASCDSPNYVYVSRPSIWVTCSGSGLLTVSGPLYQCQ